MNEKARARSLDVEVDLGKLGGRHHFKEASDLQNWITEEIGAWEWLRRHAINPGQVVGGNLFEKMSQALNQLRSDANSFDGAPPNDREKLRSSIKQHLNQLAENTDWIWSKTPEGAFVVKLAQQPNIVEAIGALAHFANTTAGSQQMNPMYISGVVRAHLFQIGIERAAQAEREALEKLRDEAYQQISEIREQASGLFDETDRQIDKRTKKVDDFDRSVLRMVQKQANNWQNTRSGIKSDLDNLKKFYTEQVALSAPKTYWDEKRQAHRKAAITFTVLFVVVGGFGAWGFYEYAKTLYDVTASLVRDAQGHLDPLSPYLWFRFALLGLIASLYYWVLRFCSRLILSNLHLGADAAQRSVMISTYLALRSDPDTATDTNMRLVLDAIFRPVSTGLIKGDSGPKSPTEFLPYPVRGGKAD